VRITVLGKSPSWQDADGACSGYLIEEDGFHLLLDCGNGVFSKLRRFVDYVDVDAVVISHLHADHFLDLVPVLLRAHVRAAPAAGAGRRLPGTDHPAHPDLHVPPGATELFRRVVGAWGNEDLIENAFAMREYDPGDELSAGPLRIRFQPVPHFVESNAVEIASANGGGRITYGADHAPTDHIVEFARDTDLLVIEATLPRPEREGPRGHITPGEAGEHARKAGAPPVLLTHFSDELGEDWARADAEKAFGGPVEMAREGAVYDV
jgi:ribonuclease BN (tRNA processing enzyme)